MLSPTAFYMLLGEAAKHNQPCANKTTTKSHRLQMSHPVLPDLLCALLPLYGLRRKKRETDQTQTPKPDSDSQHVRMALLLPTPGNPHLETLNPLVHFITFLRALRLCSAVTCFMQVMCASVQNNKPANLHAGTAAKCTRLKHTMHALN
jgi:hypothetical protein